MATINGIDMASCIRRPEKCFCGQETRPLVTTPFFVLTPEKQTTQLPSTLYYCKHCNLEIRDLDYSHPLVATHYEMAGYTQVEHEEEYLQRRRPFMTWIAELARKYLGRTPESVLDFGCSYGHLLDIFAERGSGATTGIEIAPQLVEKLQRDGRHKVYTSLAAQELTDASQDAITVIDSLYCVEGNPADSVSALAAKLRPGGVLITRTTNRNQIHRLVAWMYRLRNRGHRGPVPISWRTAGDAKLGFSQRAMARYFRQAGLDLLGSFRWEHKPQSVKRQAVDAACLALYHLSLGQLDLCSGLVLVARKPQGSR